MGTPNKSFIIHPFIFTIAPVLYFLSVNLEELSIFDSRVLLTMLAVILLAAILWLVFGFILKNKNKGAILTSLFMVFFFSYGYIHALIPNFKIPLGIITLGPDKVLFISGMLVLGAIFVWLWRTSRSLIWITGFLNVVGIALLAILLVRIVPNEFSSRKVLQPGVEHVNTKQLTAEEKEKLPDIYYIILDRYARADVLKESYGYDNSEFIGYLESKGFYVASQSYDNYPRTWTSLASSLNMKHLTYLKDELGEDFQSRLPVYKMLQDYEVWRFLKERGYKFTHFGDWVSFTSKNRFADENINYFGLMGDEFLGNFLKNTLVYPIYQKIFPLEEIIRKRHLYKFSKLQEMPAVEGPKFVFAHFLIPHEPFVFDKDGNPLTSQQVAQRSLKDNYLGQVIFLNQKMKEVIDSLLAGSAKPPIIVIQADEGPFPLDWAEKLGSGLLGLDNENLKVKTAILNAYYLPGTDTKEVLYQTVTPVNSFRIIFNQYFGSSYELLPDRVFLSEEGYPYKFIDVTDRLSVE
jgi:hypothetical protein